MVQAVPDIINEMPPFDFPAASAPAAPAPPTVVSAAALKPTAFDI